MKVLGEFFFEEVWASWKIELLYTLVNLIKAKELCLTGSKNLENFRKKAILAHITECKSNPTCKVAETLSSFSRVLGANKSSDCGCDENHNDKAGM